MSFFSVHKGSAERSQEERPHGDAIAANVKLQALPASFVDGDAERNGVRSAAVHSRGKGTGETADDAPDVVPNEYLLYFENADDFEGFLADAKRLRLDILGTLPRWRALNIRTFSRAGIERVLGDQYGSVVIERNPFVRTPANPMVSDVGVPFADGALAWLGVAGKNETWGRGLTIALLDTRVEEHPALDGVSITKVSVLGEHIVERGDYAGHGTAVASLLVGSGNI